MNAANQAGTEVFLHPGEWLFAGGDTRIVTLLGSCVSITLWHPQARVGGMCHYLLESRDNMTEVPLSGRYADEAMLLLLQQILKTGLPLASFQAKLFGGASTLTHMERLLPTQHIAASNIATARRLLGQLGLPVQAEDVGGNRPRMVRFDLASGDVWVRQAVEAEVASATEQGEQDDY